MSSKAKPSFWSGILNRYAELRGKTRNVKHLYERIEESRYRVLRGEDKAKYKLGANGKYYLKAPSNIYSNTLNKGARNARVTKMSAARTSEYPTLPPSPRSPIKSRGFTMKSTGSPLSPRTIRNRPINSYTPEIQGKILEYIHTTGNTLEEVMNKLHGYKKQTQDRILYYMKQNPESTLEEVFTFVDDAIRR